MENLFREEETSNRNVNKNIGIKKEGKEKYFSAKCTIQQQYTSHHNSDTALKLCRSFLYDEQEGCLKHSITYFIASRN